ncbi:MAG TPA: hypothetical protein VKN73_03230 [Desulfosalsimonadaceae bacterium]|nr:hypothetical protein [Desulfosalsimonadaceae bacterium]
MKRARFLFILVPLILIISCAPKTFVKTLEPTWATTEVRDDISYEEAWNTVVDTLVKDFDMEVLSKRDGYIRTNWLYTWTGEVNQRYRVRVTCKFTPDKEKLELKSEAEYKGPGGWTRGYDTRLLSTLKSDIMGKIGRATR